MMFENEQEAIYNHLGKQFKIYCNFFTYSYIIVIWWDISLFFVNLIALELMWP
jgi:hypothetical protein